MVYKKKPFCLDNCWWYGEDQLHMDIWKDLHTLKKKVISDFIGYLGYEYTGRVFELVNKRFGFK